MMTDLYNLKNEKVGTVELPDLIFGTKWNPALVKQVIESMLANQRKPWAHAKGRGEVRGGGRKPWRQKGTGRARHGSTRSPLWSGGGASHGPKKERNYTKKINKKMGRAALLSALSKKMQDAEIKFIDNLQIAEPKTKLVADFIKNFPENKTSILIIPKNSDKNIHRASSNIPKVMALAPKSLNVYEILKYKTILLDKDAVATISETYAR